MRDFPFAPKAFLTWSQLRKLGRRSFTNIKDITLVSSDPKVLPGAVRSNPAEIAVVIPYVEYLRMQMVYLRLKEFIDSCNWEEHLGKK